MIYVEYSYLRKRDGKTCHGTTQFRDSFHAIRFIRAICSRKNMSYDGFTCDDEEETYEMNCKL